MNDNSDKNHTCPYLIPRNHTSTAVRKPTQCHFSTFQRCIFSHLRMPSVHRWYDHANDNRRARFWKRHYVGRPHNVQSAHTRVRWDWRDAHGELIRTTIFLELLHFDGKKVKNSFHSRHLTDPNFLPHQQLVCTYRAHIFAGEPRKRVLAFLVPLQKYTRNKFSITLTKSNVAAQSTVVSGQQKSASVENENR